MIPKLLQKILLRETNFATYLENEKRPTYIRELEIGLAPSIGAPAELKLGLSEKYAKFEKKNPYGQLIYLEIVKTMRKIFPNYVRFSESPNFTR